MKKKFRKIVVDGDESWSWFYNIPAYRGCEESHRKLKIWKDKKIVFEKTYTEEQYQEPKNYKITPGLISRFIKTYLRNEKHTLDCTK